MNLLLPSTPLITILVGPCADPEQRIKDLYIVNTVAGWAQNNLRILAEMAADHRLPDWYVNEVKRIGAQIETVASREDSRNRRKSMIVAALAGSGSYK